MELRNIHIGLLASAIAGLSGCAQEGTFFQKGKKVSASAAESTSQSTEANTGQPNVLDAKQADDKDRNTDELQDIGSPGTSGPENPLAALIAKLGKGGLDVNQLGPLGDLLSLILPALGGAGGLGNLGDLLGALSGGDSSLLDIFKKPPASQDDGISKKKSIFGQVSSIPTVDTSEREDMFCAPAAVVRGKSEGIASLLDEICDGETAKSALISKLIKNAYDGNKKLRFHTFRALASNDATQTSSVRYGFAIKLPGTAKEHFDGVAPMQFDLDSLKAFVEAPGGTATVSILENYDNDGEYHVRGILASQRLVKEIMGFEVALESETRYDHYALEEEHYYLYTSKIENAIEGVKSTDTLSLVIQDEASAYLIALVDIESPNQGFEEITEGEIERSAEASADALYESIGVDAE